jgi:CRP/FNR family transcriptional regulator, cyclic AMP receptor protein
MAGERAVPATRWERLLDLDPELAEGLGAPGAGRARDRVGVATVRLVPGPWRPESLAASEHHPFALLVCDGVVVRELDLAGTITADLLGPGDLVSFGAGADPLLRPGERWRAGGPVTVAILDDRLLPALHAWPRLGSELIARGARQAARAGQQRAISQLPRVDLRIRALLWHLAERWGRMGVTGVVLPLELTHGALGRLVGARRPTVTLALGELARDGKVIRRPDGAWLLRADSRPPGGTGATGRVRDGTVRLGALWSPRRLPISTADHESFRHLAERIDRVRIASAEERRRSAELLRRCGRARRNAAAAD